jgi:hypothetical protein
MPMLMIKCKTCEVFPGFYVAEDSNQEFRASVTNADNSRTCSRGHRNKYVLEDYMDWNFFE